MPGGQTQYLDPMQQQKVEEEKKKKSKEKTEEEKKAEIAKAYGVNLSDIEHVKLTDKNGASNGQELFKFYNPKDRSLKIVEVPDSTTTAEQEFKADQSSLSFAQGADKRANAEAIYEYNAKHKNVELDLIPIVDISKYSLKSKYREYLRPEYSKQRALFKLLDTYLKSKETVEASLKIRYVNFKHSFIVDENNNVIEANLDNQGKLTIQSARVISHQNRNELSNDDEDLADINDAELADIANKIAEELSANMEISENEAKLDEAGARVDKTISFKGEEYTADEIRTVVNDASTLAGRQDRHSRILARIARTIAMLGLTNRIFPDNGLTNSNTNTKDHQLTYKRKYPPNNPNNWQ